MTTFSSKTAALTALITLGSLMSTSAHANILRTVEGVPVMTTGGNCVLTGTDGDSSCPTSGAAAPTEMDREKVIYFDFNKSTLTPHAKHQLDHLAWHLNGDGKHEGKDEGKEKGKHHHHHVHTIDNLVIVGYADRIGNAAYNEKLALKRAESVRDYLVSKGIKAKKIEVRSLGKTEPKADCPADLPRAKLIHCLREDRRVEIEINSK